MAQGEFTKEEAKRIQEAVEDMFEGISKTKRFDYIGHLNDISLFLLAAYKAAPNEKNRTT